MTPAHHSWLVALFMRLALLRPVEKVSDWCVANVRFNEPECSGQFSLSGREYLREPLDNWGDDSVTDQVTVFGTRMGKTRVCYGGLAYTIAHFSARCLYVKPKSKGTAGAEDDARTRFIPMIRATPALAKMIPDGTRRHDFKTAQQIIGGSIVDWTGSNSVSSLASNPCRVVIQDEVDKFNAVRKRDEQGNVVEADASALADERCKEFSTPKRFKASTPTLANGLIWQELLKSDIRRYFMPCPHCRKDVIFAWSKEYTVLKKTGCEAYVRWDTAARNADGSWNYDQVEASAHAVCPHCEGKILDTHKADMIRAGEWRATQKGAPGYRGYHLPSMYSAHQQCNFGKMAVRFLKNIHSLNGPRGFINSDLAEPYAAQDAASSRIERVSEIVPGSEWKKLLTIDCQQKAPHFWYILRAWGGKEIVGLKGGSADTWEDLRAIQRDNNVPDAGVIVDSGYGAKDDAEVYRTCAGYGELVQDPQRNKLIQIGWTPAKGMPARRKWLNTKTGVYVPYYWRPIDPYMGTAEDGKVELSLFEFSADFFKDILQGLREGRDSRYQWTISPELNNDEYHEHMRGQIKREVIKYARITMEWTRRHRYAKDHLFACEYMQVAAANAFEFLDIKEEKKECPRK